MQDPPDRQKYGAGLPLLVPGDLVFVSLEQGIDLSFMSTAMEALGTLGLRSYCIKGLMGLPSGWTSTAHKEAIDEFTDAKALLLVAGTDPESAWREAQAEFSRSVRNAKPTIVYFAGPANGVGIFHKPDIVPGGEAIWWTRIALGAEEFRNMLKSDIEWLMGKGR